MARILSALLLCSSLVHARDLDKQYKREKFKIGGQAIEAYVADTDANRSEGLMNVTKLPENTGMLFVFDGQQTLSFWMKNTLIPLAIGFIDNKGTLVDIQEMIPASPVQLQVPTYQSRKPATYALEMNKGWFTRRKVKIGAKLSPLPTRH